ncbi:MAG: plasmid recombination protein, partial [Defluviitaleaceae bacterium]|nr:plasmid recombination protein [Defluviitaleaceae bacterium]
LGRDVYHYHLHVVYVPVVQKEIKWSKRTKDKSLIGKVKEVIPQISQSNKWPLRQQGEIDGKTITLNSYSFLQDRYYEHMKEAGYEGFERGERGSTTEHLEVLDYKIQQDRIHAAELEKEIEEKKKKSAGLDSKIEKQKTAAAQNDKQLADFNNEVKSMQGKVLTVKQISNINIKISKPMLGGEESVTMFRKDWENIKKTALSQARKEEEYRTAKDENTVLKKEKFSLLNDRKQLVGKVGKLEKNLKGDLMARATKDAELYNLKNEVARIPKDIWNAYTKPKSQQKIHQQEVR